MEQVTFKKVVLVRKNTEFLIYNFKGGKVDFTDSPAKATHFDSYNHAEETRKEIKEHNPVIDLTQFPIKISYSVEG